MFKTILWILLISLFTFCKDSSFQSHARDINEDKKPDQVMHTHTGLNSAILIETDTDLDGTIDDYLWVNGKSEDKEKSMLLYGETLKAGKTIRKTWYGPGNLKLVEKSDEDNDGRMEATVYFNAAAIPGTVQGITARIEVDTNNDNITDIWVYPSLRIELDKNQDGKPDCLILWKNIKESDIATEDKWKKITSKECQKINSADSYALYPHKIENEMNQANLPYSLKE